MTAMRSESDTHDLYVGGAYARPRWLIEIVLAPLRSLAALSALAFERELPPGARMHEVGAGDGALLRAFAARGHRVSGSDPFAAATAGGGVEVTRVAAEQESLPPGSVDLVLFWHVLEHLEEPREALMLASRALGVGGKVAVAVPNAASLQARLGGDRWFHQDVPRHHVHFTRQGLVRLFERSGLKIVRIRTFAVDQNLLGFVQTLLNFVTRERNVLFRTLKRDAGHGARGDLLMSLAALLPAIVVGLVLETAAAAVKNGGSLIVLAETRRTT